MFDFAQGTKVWASPHAIVKDASENPKVIEKVTSMLEDIKVTDVMAKDFLQKITDEAAQYIACTPLMLTCLEGIYWALGDKIRPLYLYILRVIKP
jgi:hypothetical protein